MTSSFPMWLAAMFALDVAGTIDVSDTARIYAREATVGDAAAIDIENTPRLVLGLGWPVTSIDIEYAPRLFWTDVGGVDASPALLLHTGALRLSTRRERLSASVAQTFAYGDQSFARLSIDRGPLELEPTPAAPDLDLLPAATVVRIVETESSASLRYEWSRRVSTELRPSFAISGGANAAAQRALPRQRIARIDAFLDLRASPRDELRTGVGLMDTSISNGYDHRLVSLMETWSRSFAPESGTALGAGVALQDTTGPFDFASTKWRPIGMARVWYAVLARAVQVHLSSEVGHQPHVNVLTGTLQGRLYASAEAATVMGDTSVRLALGASQTLPLEEPDTAQSLTADLVLEQALLDWLSAELGGQLAWQSLGPDAGVVPSDTLWMVFAGARGELPTVRF